MTEGGSHPLMSKMRRYFQHPLEPGHLSSFPLRLDDHHGSNSFVAYGKNLVFTDTFGSPDFNHVLDFLANQGTGDG